MRLDDIAPNESVTLTAELRRLFLAAGCDPACHACRKKIIVGQPLKLVPHARPGCELRDEMCCVRCDEAALARRDKREARLARTSPVRPAGFGGYSRASQAGKA